MHIYLYEPREDRLTGLAAELRGARIVPVPIGEAFFRGDLGLLNREGHDIRPLLLAEGPATLDQIGALRGAGCRNPVVVLRDFRNARAAAQTLDHGADDDLVIPLRAVELRARVNAITRRAHGHAAQSVRIGAVTAYLDGRDPEVAGARVFLSGREHAVFQQLALNARRVVSKAAIYDALYGMAEEQPFDKVIDVYICKIRKKIDAAAGPGQRYIETVQGRGYRLAAPQDRTDAAEGPEPEAGLAPGPDADPDAGPDRGLHADLHADPHPSPPAKRPADPEARAQPGPAEAAGRRTGPARLRALA